MPSAMHSAPLQARPAPGPAARAHGPAIRLPRIAASTTPPGGTSAPGPVVAIVGGGAAGLAAAFFAATTTTITPPPRVLILERTAECGKKILVSGGTRCNALPAVPVAPDGRGDFHNPGGGRQPALRAVLGGWTVDACRAWLRGEAGVDLVEEGPTAKLFPVTGKAASVRDGLVAAAERAGASLCTGARVVVLERTPPLGPSSALPLPPWRLTMESGAIVHAHAVVLATGGLSYPGLGTDGDGHALAAALGHALARPHPALAPLRGVHPGGGGGEDGLSLTHLAGLAVRTVALFVQEAAAAGSAKKRPKPPTPASPRPDLLFTHRGFSGPAILDASHHVSAALAEGRPPPGLLAQWVAGMGAAEWGAALDAAGGASPVAAPLRARLPARLAAALLAEVRIPADKRVAELKAAERGALLAALAAFPLAVTGVDGGWGKAEVTAGGVPLSELEAATLASKLAPGVHVCGELLAPAGRLGGFNFYWAWAGGRVAGRAAAAAAVRAWEGGGGEGGAP